MPFFLLKGLSFLPFGGLLKNPKVLLAIIMIAIVAFGIWKWKKSIVETAYNAIYTQQAEQHLENQRREFERTQKLIEQGNKAVQDAHTRRETLIREVEEARRHTRNIDPSQNGEVAPVLSEALTWIRARELSSSSSGPTLGDRAKDLVDTTVENTEEAVETGNSVIDKWKKRFAQ